MLTRITEKSSLRCWSLLVGACLLVAGCNSKPADEAGGDGDQANAGATSATTTVPPHSTASTLDELPSYSDLSSSEAGTPPSAPAAQPLPVRLPNDAPPADVVSAFLEATRSGDETLAAQLLTKKALEETQKRNLVVSPPGTPSMRYTIGKIERPENADGVYVHSEWTDTFEDGQTESFNVIWVLREEAEGWRIAGMAAQMEEDELPLFLNFEQPDELRRRLEAAQEELASDAQNQPFDPGVADTQAPGSGGTGNGLRQATAPAAEAPLR